MNISRETKYQRQIEWRREKVLELASDGYGVREIARLLEISHPTVSRDMQWLRYQAKEQIRKYIDEQVPLEYHKTLTGLQNIIKNMSDIISKSTDNKEIMQASGIKMQALNMKMELVSNANLVHEAIDLIERYRSYAGQKAKVIIADYLSISSGFLILIPIIHLGLKMDYAAGIMSLAYPRKTVVNFVLPAALLAEGPLSLSLDSLIDTATGTLLQVAFNSPSTVHRVRVLAVRYNQQGSTFVATANDLQHLRSWLGRAYPVADVVWSSGTIDANNQGPFMAGVMNAQLAAIRAQDIAAGVDKRTHYYGMVADGGFFMRGLASGIPGQPDPSVVASGPTGPNSWGWDFDGSYGDWYGGHELGHTFGRFHPGSGCGESSDDPNYQYIFGQLANYDAGCVGFDVGDAALGIAMAAYPGTAWHDVMTYCNNQWLSDYTYNRIRNRLADEISRPPAQCCHILRSRK